MPIVKNTGTGVYDLDSIRIVYELGECDVPTQPDVVKPSKEESEAYADILMACQSGKPTSHVYRLYTDASEAVQLRIKESKAFEKYCSEHGDIVSIYSATEESPFIDDELNTLDDVMHLHTNHLNPIPKKIVPALPSNRLTGINPLLL